tara:strand:+ start:390 stop:545 length:156 start_codon:yes stop_codon:yes gene_type:complete
MKIILLSLFFTVLLISAFYIGYTVAIDIFELMCFSTGTQNPNWLEKLLWLK